MPCLPVAETIIFQIQLTSSWRVAYELIRSMNTGGDEEPAKTLAYTGGVLAYTLLLLEASFACKYGYTTWMIIRSEKAESTAAARHGMRKLTLFPGAPSSADAEYIKRLERRTSYMTKRFRKGAHGWQFVVWGRQALLTCLTFLPSMLGMTDDLDAGAVQQSTGNATDVVVKEMDGETRAVMIVQVVGSCLVLLGSMQWHRHAKPFLSGYQNWIEVYLFVSSCVVIVLAFVYTWLPQKVLAVEVALTTILVGTLVFTAAYLVVLYRERISAQARAQIATAARRLSSMRQSLSSQTSSLYEPSAGSMEASMSGRKSRLSINMIRTSIIFSFPRKGARDNIGGVATPIPPPPPPPPDEIHPAVAAVPLATRKSSGDLLPALPPDLADLPDAPPRYGDAVGHFDRASKYTQRMARAREQKAAKDAQRKAKAAEAARARAARKAIEESVRESKRTGMTGGWVASDILGLRSAVGLSFTRSRATVARETRNTTRQSDVEHGVTRECSQESVCDAVQEGEEREEEAADITRPFGRFRSIVMSFGRSQSPRAHTLPPVSSAAVESSCGAGDGLADPLTDIPTAAADVTLSCAPSPDETSPPSSARASAALAPSACDSVPPAGCSLVPSPALASPPTVFAQAAAPSAALESTGVSLVTGAPESQPPSIVEPPPAMVSAVALHRVGSSGSSLSFAALRSRWTQMERRGT